MALGVAWSYVVHSRASAIMLGAMAVAFGSLKQVLNTVTLQLLISSRRMANTARAPDFAMNAFVHLVLV